MFERFTERARQVVVLAQDEARGLKHPYIGTEHLLLGLLREEEGLGARCLKSLDITYEATLGSVARIVGMGGAEVEAATGQIPLTPRAKKVMELALREALSLGHNYIGTEHLLLGLVRENEGIGARILGEHGADPDRIRDTMIRLISGPRPKIEEKIVPEKTEKTETDLYRDARTLLLIQAIYEVRRNNYDGAATLFNSYTTLVDVNR